MADADRRTAEGREQQDVVGFEQARAGAAERVEGLDRLDIGRRRDALAAPVGGEGQRLHLAFGDRPAAPIGLRVQGGGDAGGDHQAGGRLHGGEVPRDPRLLHVVAQALQQTGGVANGVGALGIECD
jgi:hypothetical protein